jgi:hypothetical protein
MLLYLEFSKISCWKNSVDSNWHLNKVAREKSLQKLFQYRKYICGIFSEVTMSLNCLSIPRSAKISTFWG